MLRPCPWCGGEKIKYSIKTRGSTYDFNISEHVTRYRACYYCDSCGAYGPYQSKEYIRPNRSIVQHDEDLRKAAEERWNGRK